MSAASSARGTRNCTMMARAVGSPSSAARSGTEVEPAATARSSDMTSSAPRMISGTTDDER